MPANLDYICMDCNARIFHICRYPFTVPILWWNYQTWDGYLVYCCCEVIRTLHQTISNSHPHHHPVPVVLHPRVNETQSNTLTLTSKVIVFFQQYRICQCLSVSCVERLMKFRLWTHFWRSKCRNTRKKKRNNIFPSLCTNIFVNDRNNSEYKPILITYNYPLYFHMLWVIWI